MPIYILTDHNNVKNVHCLRKLNSGKMVHDQVINDALYTEKEWEKFIFFNGQYPNFQTVVAKRNNVCFIFGVRRLINSWEP